MYDLRVINTETIWNEFSSKLRQFILLRVSDPEAAEDILQDVFIKIHNRIDTLNDQDKLESWIYQITRNAIIDYYRAQKVTLDLDEKLTAPEDEDAEDAEKQLAPSLKAMVNALPRDYREAILLTEFDGMSQKELGERLGISFSGAKSRVQRAREKLKGMLLDCCHFEFDHFGKVIDYKPRPDCCARCECE
jgi:RNA polymerase sigma-70 factor (ECF subfamily)